MKEVYCIEIDHYNPTALASVLKELEDRIVDFEYDWTIRINGGGIDYGIFLNINVKRKEIEICNQPEYGMEGDDFIDDVVKLFEMEEDEEDESE